MRHNSSLFLFVSLFVVCEIIFSGPFVINELRLGYFEYTVLLKKLLEGVSNIAFIITAHKQTQ